MLDAFIIEQMKKAEENMWIEEQRPVLELPCEAEEPPKESHKNEEKRGIWSIQF